MTKPLIERPILTTLRDGQPYVDEAVFAELKVETVLEAAIREMFKRKLPPRLLTHYERVRLRWMKKAPDGKMVPR